MNDERALTVKSSLMVDERKTLSARLGDVSPPLQSKFPNSATLALKQLCCPEQLNCSPCHLVSQKFSIAASSESTTELSYTHVTLIRRMRRHGMTNKKTKTRTKQRQKPKKERKKGEKRKERDEGKGKGKDIESD